MYVCVLPFFLPVDIQHIQCPLPILPPREIYTSSAVTKPRHRECIPWSQKVTYTHIIRLTVVVTSSCWPWYHTRRYIIQPTAHSHNYDHPGGHRITGILCRTPYVRIHILRSIPWYSRISRKRRGHARARTYIYVCTTRRKVGVWKYLVEAFPIDGFLSSCACCPPVAEEIIHQLGNSFEDGDK